MTDSACLLFGYNWVDGWLVFFLGFTSAAVLCSCIFSAVFLFSRFFETKNYSFRIRGEVALPPAVIGKDP
ncbi:unnamed protein product [Caenorhabditis auriculariae]|uniref:Uncharacterized protein n=1 Tax=Caenorhabditis auriculariae TaxID=2777116 RepID=A0A8S1HF20_9PELO|nr:unnamed protein product [Caenorhabditis auriculariae]